MDQWELAALQSFNNTLTNNANVIMANNQSNEDREFSLTMSNLAWERNLEAWRMQNEYNLPANQYARQLEGLQANGLNPNLVYGNSSSVGGAAGSISPYKFDNYHATAVPQFGKIDSYESLLSTRLLQTQIAAAEANSRLINARADNEAARLPGIEARSNEAASRWNYIFNHMDDQESAWRAEQSMTYWKGQASFSSAEILKNRASMSYFEAAVAEWLNTTLVPGTQLTYQQYLEQYKSMLPSAQFARLKAESLDIASRIAYRKKQGELVDLKKIYQGYANKFARYGRSIGSNWANVLFALLESVFGEDVFQGAKDVLNDLGGTQLDMPETYPGP